MKRLAAAGTFTLLAGAFGLLLLASIVFSCHQGGHPHEMGTDATPQIEQASPPAVVQAPSGPDRSTGTDADRA